jgi:hypothetical protein
MMLYVALLMLLLLHFLHFLLFAALALGVYLHTQTHTHAHTYTHIADKTVDVDGVVTAKTTREQVLVTLSLDSYNTLVTPL